MPAGRAAQLPRISGLDAADVAERPPNDNESATVRFRPAHRRVVDPAHALTTDSLGPSWSSGPPLVAIIAVAPLLLSPSAVSDSNRYVEARRAERSIPRPPARRRVWQDVVGAEMVFTLVLAGGLQQEFGPRDEILRKIVARSAKAPAAGGNLKIVSDSSGGGQKI